MYLSMAACVACVYISLCLFLLMGSGCVLCYYMFVFVVVWMTHCDLVSVTLQQQQQADKHLPITKSEVGQTKKHAYKHKKNHILGLIKAFFFFFLNIVASKWPVPAIGTS